GSLTRLCPDRAIGLDELIAELTDDTRTKIVLGDGGKLCHAALERAGIESALAPLPLLHQNAVGVALAAEKLSPVSGAELQPVYLRVSQAERERAERLKNEAK
ncbi:MAG: tRNA (adenosine(37)-N6)-threonylcarbamoyltransferase complex dimerization subunit type 1 TsaB, partial [Oscillospiraceae bacterium]|nr:tRNA (adenosine(37)-N6)-threonylcarbamoyltransferase complex dimerization subunit type 1 TsaB [Oscillospiraceae bacterium]